MMMQEDLDDKNHRSMNYNKIDRCQDNFSIDNDESYRQISPSNLNLHSKQDISLQINLTNHLRLILLMFLFFTSQTHALPLYQFSPNSGNNIPYIQAPPANLPVAMIQLADQSALPPQSYRVYRRMPNPIPSYSNGAVVQNYDQQQPPQAIIQDQQIRRERQRRAMVEKIVTIFDEDGNGQLTKDELYSMALRSNMFPKFHYYLKQTSI